MAAESGVVDEGGPWTAVAQTVAMAVHQLTGAVQLAEAPSRPERTRVIEQPGPFAERHELLRRAGHAIGAVVAIQERLSWG